MENLNKKVDELFDDELRRNCVDYIDSDDVNDMKNAIKKLVTDFNKEAISIIKDTIADGQAPPYITNRGLNLIK